ncbi:autotransporter outer membrane beta-barrel domain-containing protein [Pontiella sulfatireligans]|uniref:Uncharacterized protein n=1 Tax=Pontiella sulfatireligans TaxID=2750658 RepID=A0A6C2ULN8_9BACT|nr:hypothetical protein [Pontiella sulfatireligans]VGO20823.1 hypothetical protein SCARR_02890 [Pontiella sulfatireligans]
MRRFSGVIIASAMAGLAMHAAATQIMWNGGTDLLFSTGANWEGGVVPGASDEAKGRVGLADLIVIDSDQTITKLTGGSRSGGGYKIENGTLNVTGLYVDGNTAGADCLTVIDGGTLNVSGISRMGLGGDNDTGTTTVQLKSGVFNSADAVTVGQESTGNLEISGGTATFSGSYLWLGGDSGTTDARNGNGVLTLSGDGALNVLSGNVIVGKRLGEGTFTMNDSASAVFMNLAIGDVSFVGQEGTGAMSLLGGTLNVKSDFAVDNGSVLIDAGTLVWDGEHVADFSALVAAGDISWTNGQSMLSDSYAASWTNNAAVLFVDYDHLNAGKTTVWVSSTETMNSSVVIKGISLAMLNGTNSVVRWPSDASAKYVIQSRSNLVEGSWSNIESNIPGNDGAMVITNELTEPQAFYRIILDQFNDPTINSNSTVDIRTRARLLGYLYAEGSCANPLGDGDKFAIGVSDAQNTRALWCAQQMEEKDLLTIVSSTDSRIVLKDLPWDIPYAPVSWNTNIYMTFSEGLPHDPDNPGQWAQEVYSSQFIAALIEGEGSVDGLINDQAGWGNYTPHITEVCDLLNEPEYDCDAYLANSGKSVWIPTNTFYIVRAFEYVATGRVPGGSSGLVRASTPPEYATP